MGKIKQTSFLWIVFTILFSCKVKSESKEIDNKNQKEENHNLFEGKWLPIEKNNNDYYYCTDSDKFIEINKNKIYDYTPVENSNFDIDHIKNIGNKTYLYLDKNEASYYTLSWIDKGKGIISCKLNDYDSNLFIAETKIKTIENKSCESKGQSCALSDSSNKYQFTLEGREYTNEKDQTYPISAWIIIKNQKTKKEQEIYFEPNSWATYSNLPCKDFIIKDFNFDNLEDFAIVWDEGGNAGKLYEYYFQDKNGNFSILDTFPLQHGILAEDINIENKTVTTKSIVGCCHYNLNKYKLNVDGNWLISSEQIEIKK